MINRSTLYAELFDAWKDEPFRSFLLYWDKEDPFVKGRTLGEVYEDFCVSLLSSADHIASLDYVSTHRKTPGFYVKPDPLSVYSGCFSMEITDSKGTMVLLPGKYEGIQALDEGISMGRVLNSYGYSCYVLTYGSKEKAVCPRPLEDVLSLLSFLTTSGKIRENEYMLVGFGSGGHLSALLSQEKYRKFYASVRSLCLIYPLITMGLNTDKKERSFFLPQLSKEAIEEYSAELHVDSQYPKTLLIRGKPSSYEVKMNTALMVMALTEQGIVNEIDKIVDDSPRFGSGIGRPSQGYPHYLCDFYQNH